MKTLTRSLFKLQRNFFAKRVDNFNFKTNKKKIEKDEYDELVSGSEEEDFLTQPKDLKKEEGLGEGLKLMKEVGTDNLDQMGVLTEYIDNLIEDKSQGEGESDKTDEEISDMSDRERDIEDEHLEEKQDEKGEMSDSEYDEMMDYVKEYGDNLDYKFINEDLKYCKKAAILLEEQNRIKPRKVHEDKDIISIRQRLENIVSNNQKQTPQTEQKQGTSINLNALPKGIKYSKRFSKGYFTLRQRNFVRDFPFFYEGSYRLYLKNILGRAYENEFYWKTRELFDLIDREKSEFIDKIPNSVLKNNPSKEEKPLSLNDQSFASTEELNSFLKTYLESGNNVFLKELDKFLSKHKAQIPFNNETNNLILNFYIKIDIDFAFKFFCLNKEEFSSETLINLVSKSVYLDKIGYVKEIYYHITSYNLDIKNLDFDSVFSNYINHYVKDNLSYEKATILLNYFYYHAKCLIDNENLQEILSLKNFELFVQKNYNWTERISFDPSELFMKLVGIRMINSSESLESSVSSFSTLLEITENYFSSFSRLKVHMNYENYSHLFLGDKSLSDLIFLNLENENIINYIMNIKKHLSNETVFFKNFMNLLNVYINTMGVPKGLEYENLKRFYLDLRIRSKKLRMTNSSTYICSETFLDFLYYTMKVNNAEKEQKDLLKNWKNLCGFEKSSCLIYNTIRSLLSSPINTGYYYKKVTEILNNNKNVVTNDNPYFYVFKTLSYLKDGNEDFAINYFFENLTKNIENVKESDQILKKYYDQTQSLNGKKELKPMDPKAESEKLVILNIALERSQEIINTMAEKLKSLEITVDAVMMKKIFSELSVYFVGGNDLDETYNLQENGENSSLNFGDEIIDFKILEGLIERGNNVELDDDDFTVLADYHKKIHVSRTINNDIKNLIINEIERILILNNINPEEFGNEMQISDDSEKVAPEKETTSEESEDETELGIIREEINLLKGYFSIIMNYLKVNIPNEELNSKFIKKIGMLSNMYFEENSNPLNEGVNEDQYDDTLTPIDNITNENSGNPENREDNQEEVAQNENLDHKNINNENMENKNLRSEMMDNQEIVNENIKENIDTSQKENIENPDANNNENIEHSRVNQNVKYRQTENDNNNENIKNENANNVHTEDVENTQANESVQNYQVNENAETVNVEFTQANENVENIQTEDLENNETENLESMDLSNFYKSNILNEKTLNEEDRLKLESIIMSKSEEINKKADYFKERAEKYYQQMRKKYFKYIRTPHIVENLEFVRDKFNLDLFTKNNDFATSLTEAEDYLTRVIKGFESFRQKGRVYGGFIRNSRGNYYHNRAFRFYPTMSIMKRAQSSITSRDFANNFELLKFGDKCLRKYFIHSLNKSVNEKRTPSLIVKEKLLTNELFKHQLIPRRITVSSLICSSPYLLSMNTLLSNLTNLERSLLKNPKNQELNEQTEENGDNTTENLGYSLWDYYISNIFTEVKINSQINSIQEKSEEEKINLMKNLLNQNYEMLSPELIYEMIEFGIDNNLPIAIKLGEKALIQFNYDMPKWLELRVNSYLITNNENYKNSSRKIGALNLNNLYNQDKSNKLVTSGNYDAFKYADPKKKYEKYKEPSMFTMDYKKYGGLEDILDLKKLEMMKAYDTGSIKIHKI